MESTAVEVMDLTVPEKQKLEQLESVIERGMKSFCEVGRALLEIRKDRLYRDSHRTFDDYCRDRWRMGRNYANKLIAAAGVSENLGTVVPIAESQARPLTRLEPDEQREAWQQAVETAPGGKVTAAHVEKVVQEKITGTRVQDRYKNVRQVVELDEAFKESWEKLYARLVSMNQSGWKTMKKETARDYIEILKEFLSK